MQEHPPAGASRQPLAGPAITPGAQTGCGEGPSCLLLWRPWWTKPSFPLPLKPQHQVRPERDMKIILWKFKHMRARRGGARL